MRTAAAAMWDAHELRALCVPAFNLCTAVPFRGSREWVCGDAACRHVQQVFRRSSAGMPPSASAGGASARARRARAWCLGGEQIGKFTGARHARAAH
eukprot:scaffold41525_cov73-Phaeocystis_antarctica.AAC.3